MRKSFLVSFPRRPISGPAPTTITGPYLSETGQPKGDESGEKKRETTEEKRRDESKKSFFVSSHRLSSSWERISLLFFTFFFHVIVCKRFPLSRSLFPLSSSFFPLFSPAGLRPTFYTLTVSLSKNFKLLFRLPKKLWEREEWSGV